MIWILGVTACFTKFTSLDSGTDKGGGEVVATKSLKASSKILRHSFVLKSGGGSIPKASLTDPEAGSVDLKFDHDADLI